MYSTCSVGTLCQVFGGLAKGCIDWLLNRSVWYLSLILGAEIMAKGSLVPDIQAQEGREKTKEYRKVRVKKYT